jgi:hypothetical protein
MSAGLIFLENDHLIRARQLSTIDQTGTVVYLDSGATVTCTLTDSAGVALGGETWPLALAYVPGSQGLFQGVIRDTVVLPPAGSTVLATLTVDNGADQRGTLTGRLTVQERTW